MMTGSWRMKKCLSGPSRNGDPGQSLKQRTGRHTRVKIAQTIIKALEERLET